MKILGNENQTFSVKISKQASKIGVFKSCFLCWINYEILFDIKKIYFTVRFFMLLLSR